jgi:hypothetical protein
VHTQGHEINTPTLSTYQVTPDCSVSAYSNRGTVFRNCRCIPKKHVSLFSLDAFLNMTLNPLNPSNILTEDSSPMRCYADTDVSNDRSIFIFRIKYSTVWPGRGTRDGGKFYLRMEPESGRLTNSKNWMAIRETSCIINRTLQKWNKGQQGWHEIYVNGSFQTRKCTIATWVSILNTC